MGHSENSSQGFYFLPRLYFIKLLQYFQISKITFYQFYILFGIVLVTSQWDVLRRRISQYLKSEWYLLWFLVFLILLWFSQYFLHVLNEALFFCISLPPWNKCSLSTFCLKILSFLFFHRIFKNFITLPVKEKSTIRHIRHNVYLL